MLLTLSVNSVRSLFDGAKSKLSLLDLPKFARNEIGLHGLNVQTRYLAGWDIPKIDRLRDEADKAACPCLILIEDEPQRLGDRNIATDEAAVDRMDRVLRVAHRLGCSGVAMPIADPGTGGDFERLAARLRTIVQRAERLEMNLLITPAPGPTARPEELTALIRKVGGFRIGSFPDFQTAAATDDPTGYLRSLTPYASAVCASSLAFDKSGEHTGFDLKTCVQAITSVGYDGTLSLEYRGKGDVTAALLATRAIIESVAQATHVPEDE